MNRKFRETDFSDFKNSILIIDIDGTLVVDGSREIEKKEKDKFLELSLENEVYICSNGNDTDLFKSILNTKVLNSKKPFISREARLFKKESSERNKKIFVIGDKFLTDGLFALLLGARFIKVDHKVGSTKTFFERSSYFIDDIVYTALKAIRLIRPFSWVKSLLVFAPIFFAGSVLSAGNLIPTLIAFLSFCLASSSVYILNDIKDIETDRIHPTKKYRSLARGDFSIWFAYLEAISLLIFAFLLAFEVPQIVVPIAIYVVLNGLYTLKLKHLVVMDIVLISVFYLLRILVGGLAASVYVSPWIIMCAFFGSLFVIIGKRRAEHVRINRRAVLDDYSDKALDYMLAISASLAVMGYAIWSVIEHDSSYLVYSTIFVVFALFKVLNRVYTHPEQAESPEALVFKDKAILLSFILWVVYMFFIFY